MPKQLTPEQLEAYRRDGYIAVEDLVSPSEVEELGRRLREYTHGGRSLGEIRIQVEPRVERGELEVDYSGRWNSQSRKPCPRRRPIPRSRFAQEHRRDT